MNWVGYGGLDSRAIASAIPSEYYPIHTLTFGREGCDDYKIAKKVCEKLGIKHHFVEITATKWFQNIEKAIWFTDGHKNIIHLHCWDFMDIMKRCADINLDGFAGDLVIGGSFLKEEFLNIEKIVNKNYIEALSRKDINILFSDEDKFYSSKILSIVHGKSQKAVREEIEHWSKDSRNSDYFFLNTHCIRFTLMGTVFVQTKLENRKPFFDNDFIEFVYSLPNELRFNS